MGSTAAAGSTLAISAAAPAAQDAAGYGALVLTEVGQVEKIGAIGATSAKVAFQPVKGAKQKYKGSKDYGALQPSFAIDGADAGQALMQVAADDESQKLYTFRVTYPDGAKRYFQGRNFGQPENGDGADSMLMATPTIEICTKVVRVPGPSETTPTPTPTPTLAIPATALRFSDGTPPQFSDGNYLEVTA